jgi:hypothetical protein
LSHCDSRPSKLEPFLTDRCTSRITERFARSSLVSLSSSSSLIASLTQLSSNRRDHVLGFSNQERRAQTWRDMM